MEVYAKSILKVEVAPIAVIEKLIDTEIGTRSWVFEEDGKFFKGYEVGAGCHSFDQKEPISEDLYKYIMSLKNVRDYLKAKK